MDDFSVICGLIGIAGLTILGLIWIAIHLGFMAMLVAVFMLLLAIGIA